jgi:hypothetical protein
MKAIDVAVAGVDGLQRLDEGRSDRGVSRTVVYSYTSRAGEREGLNPSVILEMGIRGGPYPAEPRTIQSMLGAALEGMIDDTGTQAFALMVLHPKRTLVEKLSAFHTACEAWSETGDLALVRKVRHLSDIDSLLQREDLEAFVGTDEYLTLISEVDAIGVENFPSSHRRPPEGRFAASPAFGPEGALLEAIRADYDRSEFLFYGDRAELDDILARLAPLRERL